MDIDRLVFAGLYRLAPGVLDALKIVRPETPVVMSQTCHDRSPTSLFRALEIGVILSACCREANGSKDARGGREFRKSTDTILWSSSATT
jgi:hypothetical protein